MKFVISTSALLSKMQLIGSIIGTNTVIPICECFLFDIKKGKLTLSATDLEISISVSIPVETKESIIMAIPAKILIDTLKNLPEQPLTFTLDDEKDECEIKTDNGRYHIAGQPGKDFPKLPVAKDSVELRIPADTLLDIITKTLIAISSDELRPAMTGVFFHFVSGNGLTCVATDAHKLIKYHLPTFKNEIEGDFIIPKKALMLLKSAFTPSDVTNISVAFNKSNAFFNYDGLAMVCRLVDARYPSYDAVIPKENNDRLTVSRYELLSSLKRLVLYTEKNNRQLIMELGNDKLTIRANDMDNSLSGHEQLPCTFTGTMQIGFNAKMLLELLSVLEGEDVFFDLGGSTRATIILPAEQDAGRNLFTLLMPCMIGE